MMLNLAFSSAHMAEGAAAGAGVGAEQPAAINNLPFPTGSETQEELSSANPKKKRSRRRRRPRCRKVEPIEKQYIKGKPSKKQHDAPMTKRDLYFSLHCEMVGIGKGASAVARVTLVNWDTELVLDTFVQVPVPVTDFRGTGINPNDVHCSNPRAMSFVSVRQAIDQILRGKILIGHNLYQCLTALGLSHPESDVRDTFNYHKFLVEGVDGVSLEPFMAGRSLEDLAGEFLLRELNGPMNPMERCVAALDLYKSFRREWEESLIQRSQEKESVHQQAYQNNEFLSNMTPILDQQPVPTDYGESINPYAKMSQDRSWFTLGRSCPQRYIPPQEAPVAAQVALSSQALEVLNYEHFDAASAYDSSTIYDPSTDYGSSYYEESVMSESVDSAAMPSVTQEATGYQASSSWFRFGSRKTRYSQADEALAPFPEAVAMPSPEPELTVEPNVPPEYPKLPLEYESPKYFTSPVPEENKPSSSWFTFRRPKSPGRARSSSPTSGKMSSKQAEDRCEEPKSPFPGTCVPNVNGETDEIVDVDEPRSADADNGANPILSELTQADAASIQHERSSSWFSFRKRNSIGQTKRRNSQEHTQEDKVTHEDKGVEPVVLSRHSSQATEAPEGEEDWLQEVMNPTCNDGDEKDDIGFAWSKQRSESLSTDEVVSGTDTQQSSQSSWFRFLRSSKSPRNEESQLRFQDGLDRGDQWVHNQDSTGQDGALNPSWFATETPSSSAGTGAGCYTGLYMPRNRLCTESTIPTIASASEEAEDDDSEEYPEDFVEGMEQNLAFLNI